jgi:ribosomal protein S18 acetylase RimI-like enzyme
VEGLLDYAIVPAGPGDAGELGRVHVQSWRETYPGLLPEAYLKSMRPLAHARRFYRDLIRAGPGELLLLAEGAGGPVGYAAGTLQGGEGKAAEAEVFTLYVLRTAQNYGLGRALLGAAARVFQAQGAKSLSLSVLSGNLPARGFYEHLGGEAIAETPSRGWGAGVTETIYRWGDIALLAR